MTLKTLKASVPLLRSTLAVAQPMYWRAGEESSSKRGYGYKWQQARTGYLAKHPLYVYCEQAGRVTETTVVDHRVPHQGDQTAGLTEMVGGLGECLPHQTFARRHDHAGGIGAHGDGAGRRHGLGRSRQCLGGECTERDGRRCGE